MLCTRDFEDRHTLIKLLTACRRASISVNWLTAGNSTAVEPERWAPLLGGHSDLGFLFCKMGRCRNLQRELFEN